MKVTTVGIDLAKNIFGVHGCDPRGRVVVTKSLTHRELRTFMAKLCQRLVGMEVCQTAHYWAHKLEKVRSPSEADGTPVYPKSMRSKL